MYFLYFFFYLINTFNIDKKLKLLSGWYFKKIKNINIIYLYTFIHLLLFYRILVGAPLGQNLQPKTNQSGALWKCPLTSLHKDCTQVITDGRRSKSIQFLTFVDFELLLTYKVMHHFLIWKVNQINLWILFVNDYLVYIIVFILSYDTYQL